MDEPECELVGRVFLWLWRWVAWSWNTGLSYVFWSALPFCFGWAIPHSYHWTEYSVRSAGCFLQLSGLVGIVWGVIRTRKQFRLPSVREHFARQLRQTPHFPPKSGNVAIAMSSLGGLNSTASAVLVTGPAPDVSARLDALEKEIGELRTMTANHWGDTSERFRKHAAELDKERTDRANENAHLSTMLYQTATGGFDLAIYGVAALLVANFYCTFPQEFSCYVRLQSWSQKCATYDPATKPGPQSHAVK